MTEPPLPAHRHDDMLLKAYAVWTANPAAAIGLFAAEIARHRQRLGQYEADWVLVESHHNGGPPPVTHPEFGTYATLRCGIDHERQRIAWLEWLSRQLAAPHDPPPDQPDGGVHGA